MGYNLPVNGVYWGYNLLTNLLYTNFLGHPSRNHPFYIKEDDLRILSWIFHVAQVMEICVSFQAKQTLDLLNRGRP